MPPKGPGDPHGDVVKLLSEHPLFAQIPDLTQIPGIAEILARAEAAHTLPSRLDQAVQELQNRHAGNRWRSSDPLYALNQPLLDLLARAIPKNGRGNLIPLDRLLGIG
jgi:hypothetical protein